MTQESAVIIGAGPGGLACADELLRHGIRPVVLEKANMPGGLARTEVYKGYHFDIGGHRFYTKMRGINQLWHEMLGDDFLKVDRLSRIYFNGRFFNYPLTPFSTLSNLGILEAFRILASYAQSQVFPYRNEETFEQWVSNRFGRRLYESFFKNYTEKVWGIPCTELSADWAAQRIKGLSLVAAVSNALLGQTKAKSLIDQFEYPKQGPGLLWRRFVESIEARGGEIQFNTDVSGISVTDGKATGVRYTTGGEEREIKSDRIISSMPLSALITGLDPAPPAEVLDAAGRLTYRAFLTVGLIVDRPDLFKDQWVYVHAPEVKVGRIQNFKSWSKDMSADPSKTNVGLEYFCTEEDEIWCTPDDELVELATRELASLGLTKPEEVIDGFVIRQPKAYPVYNEEYRECVEQLQQYLEKIENLQTIGRNGMHRYNNMDHSMQTGILAARNLNGANHDLWAVNDEQEYLESGDAEFDTAEELPAAVVGSFARLDSLAFGAAAGCVSGLFLLVATLWLVVKGGPVVGPNLRLLGQYFPGYSVSVLGALLGFFYAGAVGFAGGWGFAFLRDVLLGGYFVFAKRKAELFRLIDPSDRS